MSTHGIEVPQPTPSAPSAPAAAATRPEGPSHMFQKLMELMMHGELSAVRAQEIAEGDFLDAQNAEDTQHPEMQMLAACGDHGAHPGNVWRDLARNMRLSDSKLPGPCTDDDQCSAT